MRHANALGARFAVVLGEQELASGEVTLRNLSDGSQESVAFAEVAARIRSDASP